MRKRHYAIRMFVVVFLFSVTSLSAETQVTLGEIKKSLICLCECNMTVEACEGAMACESAEKLTGEVRELVGKEMDKKQVLASFVTRYGEQILAEPTKKGFNLTAWILPFAAILVAGLGIVSALRRWVARRLFTPPVMSDNDAEANDSEYKEKLEEALRSLD